MWQSIIAPSCKMGFKVCMLNILTAAHLHMRGISCPYQEKKQGNIITKQEGDVGEGRKDLTPHPSFSTPSHAPAKSYMLAFAPAIFD